MTDDDLRLADFRPRSSLRVPAHEVRRPRFPVVDAHNHLGSAFGGEWATRAAGRADRDARRVGRRDGRRPRRRPGRRALRARSSAGRPRTRTGSPSSPGSTTTAGRTDPAFGETEAARLRDSAARGARGLKVWKLLGLRARDPDGRLVAVDDPRLDPLWAAAAELGPPGRHPHRRPDRVLRAARRDERALGGAPRPPGLALLADRGRPTMPDAPGFPAVRRAAGRVRAARRPPSGDDVRRRPRRLRGGGPRRSSARLLDDEPEPQRRHRRAARRARPPAVHGPGLLPALRRPDPVRRGHGARPGRLRDPLPVPRDVRRVVRLRHGRRARPGPLADPRDRPARTTSCARSTATTPGGSSGWRRRDRRAADRPIALGTRRGLDACASAARDVRRPRPRPPPEPAQGAPPGRSRRRSRTTRWSTFKRAVVRALAPVATGTLLDPEIGAAQCIADGSLPGSAGLIVAIEATGYDGPSTARISRVLDGWSVEKAKRMGASAAKLLVYYHPEAAERRRPGAARRRRRGRLPRRRPRALRRAAVVLARRRRDADRRGAPAGRRRDRAAADGDRRRHPQGRVPVRPVGHRPRRAGARRARSSTRRRRCRGSSCRAASTTRRSRPRSRPPARPARAASSSVGPCGRRPRRWTPAARDAFLATTGRDRLRPARRARRRGRPALARAAEPAARPRRARRRLVPRLLTVTTAAPRPRHRHPRRRRDQPRHRRRRSRTRCPSSARSSGSSARSG